MGVIGNEDMDRTGVGKIKFSPGKAPRKNEFNPTSTVV
jgi:hypothetical protein